MYKMPEFLEIPKGPWAVGSLPPPNWRYVWGPNDNQVVAAVAEFNDDGSWHHDFDPKNAETNSQLIALAPDHALLLRAIAMGRAEAYAGTDFPFWVHVKTEDYGGKAFPCEPDPFGIPALTPELRAALREAVASAT